MSNANSNPNPNADAMQVLLVGGPYAGLKTLVPAGAKVVNLPILDESNEVDRARSIKEALEKGPQGRKAVLYGLEQCVVASPTLDDVTSFYIGLQPGVKMTDAFMEILAGYCFAMRGGVNEEAG